MLLVIAALLHYAMKLTFLEFAVDGTKIPDVSVSDKKLLDGWPSLI